ncbi:hypothetical protein [Hymenobacter edaphi]|uniref:Uncharacterized protein n=1 Tax=Hymenobacter edaphi TaxID=2211146 RepID=A0A328BQJ1_9BACT|nr:hypothetical protein [Hymenobacter edaphi]RAK69522.1 hypothetical protein DLM85_01270 [Hymenobacter edaphi]
MPETAASSATEALDLMQQYGTVLRRLTELKVCRTNNSPIGDYTEWLVAQKLGLGLENNSKLWYDAYRQATPAAPKIRYQIKGRRMRSKDKNVEFSAIRGLHHEHFEYLIIVAFNEDFGIEYALQIPHAVVPGLVKMSTHVNAHRLVIRPSQLSRIRQLSDVLDLTSVLSAAAAVPA